MTTRSRTARRPVVVAGARRRRAWHDLEFATTIANGTQVFSDLLQNLPATEQMGCTITRIITRLSYSPVVTIGADGAQVISVGICIVSEESFNASVLPDPDVNADDPVTGWLLKTQRPVRVMLSPDDVLHGVIHEDLRAQRKMGNRAKLVIITNSTADEATSFDVRVVGIVRTLCLLP